LIYLLFGVLTTLVNYLIYFPLYNWLHCSAAFSNAIAWAVAVVFAYLTNKPFVFRSNDWSSQTIIPELFKFVSCRIGSGLIETIILWILVDLLQWNGNLVKVFLSVLVVVLNYISSKWIVFNKKEEK
jgi:putative flippase GtrA